MPLSPFTPISTPKRVTAARRVLEASTRTILSEELALTEVERLLRRLYSPDCRQGALPETHIQYRAYIGVVDRENLGSFGSPIRRCRYSRCSGAEWTYRVASSYS